MKGVLTHLKILLLHGCDTRGDRSVSEERTRTGGGTLCQDYDNDDNNNDNNNDHEDDVKSRRKCAFPAISGASAAAAESQSQEEGRREGRMAQQPNGGALGSNFFGSSRGATCPIANGCEWACLLCTYSNKASRRRCEMCDTARHKAPVAVPSVTKPARLGLVRTAQHCAGGADAPSRSQTEHGRMRKAAGATAAAAAAVAGGNDSMTSDDGSGSGDVGVGKRKSRRQRLRRLNSETKLEVLDENERRYREGENGEQSADGGTETKDAGPLVDSDDGQDSWMLDSDGSDDVDGDGEIANNGSDRYQRATRHPAVARRGGGGKESDRNRCRLRRNVGDRGGETSPHDAGGMDNNYTNVEGEGGGAGKMFGHKKNDVIDDNDNDEEEVDEEEESMGGFVNEEGGFVRRLRRKRGRKESSGMGRREDGCDGYGSGSGSGDGGKGLRQGRRAYCKADRAKKQEEDWEGVEGTGEESNADVHSSDEKDSSITLGGRGVDVAGSSRRGRVGAKRDEAVVAGDRERRIMPTAATLWRRRWRDASADPAIDTDGNTMMRLSDNDDGSDSDGDDEFVLFTPHGRNKRGRDNAISRGGPGSVCLPSRKRSNAESSSQGFDATSRGGLTSVSEEGTESIKHLRSSKRVTTRGGSSGGSKRGGGSSVNRYGDAIDSDFGDDDNDNDENYVPHQDEDGGDYDSDFMPHPRREKNSNPTAKMGTGVDHRGGMKAFLAQGRREGGVVVAKVAGGGGGRGGGEAWAGKHTGVDLGIGSGGGTGGARERGKRKEPRKLVVFAHHKVGEMVKVLLRRKKTGVDMKHCRRGAVCWLYE